MRGAMAALADSIGLDGSVKDVVLSRSSDGLSRGSSLPFCVVRTCEVVYRAAVNEETLTCLAEAGCAMLC